MVNINNLNVGVPVDVNEVKNRPQTQPAQQTTTSKASGFKSDGYNFDLSNSQVAPVPDIKIGLWDKVSTNFKDVYQSEENIKRFVAFEKAMDSNPQGFLKAGSNDIGKINDLQKKLQLMGYDITINGKFGQGTEKAVIDFKKSVGLNDGYLDKNQNFAVSSIVTPDTWSVLNANVAVKLNPSANINAGTYAPPVTGEELSWAKGLQDKITKFGYKPSKAEADKYSNIYQRQKMATQVQQNSFNPTQIAPPTQQELAWAKDLVNKVKNYGYKPSQVEQQKYEEIHQKQQLTKSQQPQIQSNNVSQEDINWATDMMQKVKAGYDPTPQEAQKYQKVYQSLQSQQKSQTENKSITQDDLVWAKNLETKVNQGYHPTAEERNKYDNIFAQYKQNVQADQTQVSTQSSGGKPTEDELKWASDFENKVNSQSYQPNQQEIDKYNDILARYNKFSSSESTQDTTTQETNPTKSSTPIRANDPLHGNTVEVFGRVGHALQDWNTAHPNTTFPRDHVFYSSNDGTLISQLQLNEASKTSKSYISDLGLNGASALYIPNLSPDKASNYNYLNGRIYNKDVVGQTVDLRVRNQEQDTPKTNNKPKTKPQVQDTTDDTEVETLQSANKPQAKTNSTVTQEELVWAKNLEDKVSSQQYKPTQDEVAKYTDIYNRAQAMNAQGNDNSQAQLPESNTATQDLGTNNNISVAIDPNNKELSWALALLDKVQGGYQPTQQELTAYEQIVAKNQTVPYTP